MNKLVLVFALLGFSACTNEVSDTEPAPVEETDDNTYRQEQTDAVEVGRQRGERIVNPDALATATSDFCAPELGDRVICNSKGEPIEIR